jgi:hypothetical protein
MLNANPVSTVKDCVPKAIVNVVEENVVYLSPAVPAIPVAPVLPVEPVDP